MNELAAKSGISAELWGQIIYLLRKFEVEKAVLFGSRARGDFTDASDIDIAYWGSVDEPQLWAALEQLPTVHKIDLANFYTLINKKLVQNILIDAVEII